MKIKMERSVAVRGGSYSSGREVDAPDGLARSMVKAGHAVPMDPDALAALEEALTTESPSEEQPESTEAEAEEGPTEPDPESDDSGDDHAEDDAEPGPEAEEEGYGDMTLAQLREAAKAQDLATSGKKADLIARLRGE